MEDGSAPITEDIYHINDIVDRAFFRQILRIISQLTTLGDKR